LRENFNAALALRDLLQQFEPVGVPERLCDRGKLREECVLRILTFHSKRLYHSIYHLNDFLSFVNLPRH
jgi:hypothetical protein